MKTARSPITTNMGKNARNMDTPTNVAQKHEQIKYLKTQIPKARREPERKKTDKWETLKHETSTSKITHVGKIPEFKNT